MKGLFQFLKIQKTIGYLYNKTPEQKVTFFQSLRESANTNEQSFKDQYYNLLPHERKEFCDWVLRNNDDMRQIKEMVDVIAQLLEEKHNYQPIK
jgi:hypothetical protein